MSDIVKNLRKLCDAHEEQLNDLRLKIRELEGIPKAKALVGKCFKYHGGFGMFNYKRAWIYKRVVASDKEYIFVDIFQIDAKTSKVEIDYAVRESAAHFGSQNCTEITTKEYVSAYKNMINRLLKLGQKRGYNGKK